MRTVPMVEWGKDHWSLLAYVETCCVDTKGVLDHDRMRTNVLRHPGLVGPRVAMIFNALVGSGTKPYRYPTRLRNGTEPEHDDWDCFYDLEAAGLIEDDGTGIHPVARMTPSGTQLAAEIRKHKSSGGSLFTFIPGLSEKAGH